MKRVRVFRQETAKDGHGYVIREAEVADAAQMIAHARTMLIEPQWNITELQEFGSNIDQEEEWILTFRGRPRNLLLVADFGSPGAPHIVGVLSLSSQPRVRVRHRGRVGIGVQVPYRHLGVGEGLMRTCLEWASAEPELERIELSVFAHNVRAMNLYLKCGFVEEARLLKAYKLADGTYYDDVMMVKWVKEPSTGQLSRGR